MAANTPSTAEKRTESRRYATLLDRSLPVPVASLWAATLHKANSGRLSDSGSLSQLQGQAHRGAHPQQGTRFCTTKTEDAMDSILPCAAEEWFRPVMQHTSKFGNPAKLKFRYSAH